MNYRQVDWGQLEKSYPEPLITAAREALSKSGPITISVDDLIGDWPDGDEETTLALFRDLVSRGILEEKSEVRCKCEALLTRQEIDERRCTSCQESFDSRVEWPITKLSFLRADSVTRDVRWLLTLHGMNTTGVWQEEFNWLVSRSYGYSVPVAIYKYGIVRPGAFLGFRHKALTRKLVARIARLVGETHESGFGGIPDVIAHSLGTLLLGKALLDNPNLKVGRVILAGSILRPDFDWATLIEKGQVEAVLNHFGTRDFWAGIAHYFVPDSGPSGRRGFNSSCKTIGYRAAGLGHNDFFALDRIKAHFNEVWAPFLTKSPERLHEVGNQHGSAPKDWKETFWVFRATLPRYALLLFFGYLAFLLLRVQVLGILAATR